MDFIDFFYRRVAFFLIYLAVFRRLCNIHELDTFHQKGNTVLLVEQYILNYTTISPIDHKNKYHIILQRNYTRNIPETQLNFYKN